MRARPGFAGKGDRVVLVGMMGSGKSTVGRLFAERTGWPYLDNDELLARGSKTTAKGLAAKGEAGLRRAESDALRLGLECEPPCIVGAAAGTILDEGNRRALRDRSLVVWLRASVATLSRRAVGAAHRPWLEGDADGWLKAAVAERDPLYAGVADVVVETDGRTPEQVAYEIIALVALGSAVGAARSRGHGRSHARPAGGRRW
jgi:shikimate kinase